MEYDFKIERSALWDLLTNPEMTKQYMFGSEVISNWEVGSSVLWKGLTEDQKEILYVKGEVTEIQMGEKVTFTMFDPNIGVEDVPENYVSLTYELKDIEGGTRLLLTQGDFATVANGKGRMEDSAKGWEMVLPAMKELVEK